MDILLAREVRGGRRRRAERQTEEREAVKALRGGPAPDKEGVVIEQAGVDHRAGQQAHSGEREGEVSLHPRLSLDAQVGLQGEGSEKEARQHCAARGEAGFLKKNEELLKNIPDGFTIVCLDESFFFYDSLVRRVWIEADSRPVVTVTGSHQHSCVFGALSLDGRQLFRQYKVFDEDTFLDYLKLVYCKFNPCVVFLDKARQHHDSEKVLGYFERHSDALMPRWQPTSSPQFMPFEECWNISKGDLLVLKYDSSFTDFKKRVGKYFRTKHFNLDIRNFLLAEPC